MRRRTLRIAVPACAAALGMAPMVARADVVPAPPGHASGVAAQVGPLLDISKTDATADSGAPSAQASVIRLAGQPLLGTGGTQSGEGDTAGSLVDSGAGLPARVRLAPWRAGAHTSGATRHATSSAAVARSAVPKVADAGVLTSDSDASYTADKSSGTAQSDGANVGLVDTIRVVVLHSEVTTDGNGHSYLLGLNGTEIGTDDQLGHSPLCALNAPGLLGVSCLSASGGNGTPGAGALTSPSAEVARVVPAVDALGLVNPVAAISTAASSGPGSAPVPAAPLPAAAGETGRGAAPSAAGATVQIAGQTLRRSTGGLPRTGTNPEPLLAAGLAAVLGGVGLRRLRPQRGRR